MIPKLIKGMPSQKGGAQKTARVQNMVNHLHEVSYLTSKYFIYCHLRYIYILYIPYLRYLVALVVNHGRAKVT